MAGMARFRRSNPLALAALVTLFDEDRHPYDIARTLKHRHHDRSMRLNFGSLYGVMASLERHGLVEVVETEREGNRPERTIYAITAGGRDEARAWLSDLLATPAKEYLQFEAALTLIASLPPEEVAELLGWRLDALVQREAIETASLRAGRSELGLPRVLVLEAEYGLALLRAEIEFVEALRDELTSGTFPQLDEWRAHRFARFRPAVAPRTSEPPTPQEDLT